MAAFRLSAFALPLVLLIGCGRSTTPSPTTPADTDGHQAMRGVLAEIAASTPAEHPYLGTAKARQLRLRWQRLKAKQTAPTYDHWKLLYDLGKAETRLGRLREGVDRLSEAYQMLPKVDFIGARADGGALPQTEGSLATVMANRNRFYLGVAYLRLAETQNCCLKHNAESCILPIQGGGLHTQKQGSQKAAEMFLEILENHEEKESVDALEIAEAARWLLNVAQMTLGQYPQAVPEAYRTPETFFQSEVEFPRFVNVAPKLQLDTFNLCGGAVADDFDNDGDLDVVTTTWDTAGEMRFFRNNADGTFSNHTDQAGLSGFFGGLNLLQADYDNDGDLDLYVLRGAWLEEYGRHPNSLLQNDGTGKFRDVTFEAGMGDNHYPCKTAAWADYDNDGDLDLFVGNESTQELRAPPQLFQNQGDGTFRDAAEEAGLAEPLFAMGAVWGDYDNDRFPDLYVSTGFSNPRKALDGGGPNRLYRNRGDGTFVELAGALQVQQPIAGFPAWFWDFNNDGALDIYASCSSGPVGVLVSPVRFGRNCLYQNDGRGGFQEVAETVGLDYPSQPMGANFGDLNNDGFLDFYLATGNIQYSEVRPNVMFLNQGGKKFVNVTMAGGFGHLQKGHGVSFADLDNDGDQDIYVQMGGAWPGDKYSDALFENPGFGNHWIALRLEGRKSNRAGVGARIRVDITEDGASRSIYRQVSSGGSFGANPLRQEIGLGKAEKIDRLEIYWPTSEQKQVFEDVEADRFLRIVEGEEAIQEEAVKGFEF